MTKLHCECRTITECINLNDGWTRPSWNYLLKTYVNFCGKCGKKQVSSVENHRKPPSKKVVLG